MRLTPDQVEKLPRIVPQDPKELHLQARHVLEILSEAGGRTKDHLHFQGMVYLAQEYGATKEKLYEFKLTDLLLPVSGNLSHDLYMVWLPRQAIIGVSEMGQDEVTLCLSQEYQQLLDRSPRQSVVNPAIIDQLQTIPIEGDSWNGTEFLHFTRNTAFYEAYQKQGLEPEQALEKTKSRLNLTDEGIKAFLGKRTELLNLRANPPQYKLDL